MKITPAAGVCCCCFGFTIGFLIGKAITVNLIETATGDVLTPAELQDGPGRETTGKGSVSSALLIKLLKLAIAFSDLELPHVSMYLHHVCLNNVNHTA